jgi:hypothetical protein
LDARGGQLAYYVIGQDGGRYGPADIAQLNQWALENRLSPSSMLEEEGTGSRIVASQLAGLWFPAQNPQGPLSSGPSDQPFSGYMRPQQVAPTSGGQTEVTLAWVFGSIGFLCCPIVFSVAGIILASVAKNKGNPSGGNALIFCIVSLVVGMTLGVVLNVGRMMGGGGNPF